MRRGAIRPAFDDVLEFQNIVVADMSRFSPRNMARGSMLSPSSGICRWKSKKPVQIIAPDSLFVGAGAGKLISYQRRRLSTEGA